MSWESRRTAGGRPSARIAEETWQLYVRAIAEVGRLQPVAAFRANDQGLQWSASSRELLFTRPSWSPRYSDCDGRFTVRGERIVARVGADDRVYGVSPDGQRFLIGVRMRPSAGESGIRVVVNGLAGTLNASAP